MLDEQVKFYRRDLWLNQPVDVEVWLEKDALSGVIWPVTSEWDVPLMVTRGYPSRPTFLHGAAEEMASTTRTTHVYYIGTLHPSGKDIPRMVEENLREDGPDGKHHLHQVGGQRGPDHQHGAAD